MNRALAIGLLVVALGGTSACTATRAIRPVGQGKWAAGASLGGPVFTNLGAPIPSPLVSAYGRYGLTDRTDLEFGLNPTVVRALGLDVGASHLVLDQAGAVPAVMLNGRLYAYGNVKAITGGERGSGTDYTFAPRVYEELQATASWKLDRVLLYAGVNVFAQVERATFLPSVLAGVEWRIVPLFGLQLEVKQMAATDDQLFAAVNYLGPANRGALAVQLGFNFFPGAN